jgi:lipoic acid synthetase
VAKPEWLKIPLSTNTEFSGIHATLQKHKLHTVCQEAHCPNISECWNGGTATFMVMGDTCTRGCKFCAVKTAFPASPLDPDEPRKLAQAIAEIGMFDYVVVTSVDRDDLKDQGASHFAECIKEIKKAHPGIIVEVLIPDFRGNDDLIKILVDANPDVIAHNIETVERLQKKVRDPRANYRQSLHVLETVKKLNPRIYTKSSIMLGLGEETEEVEQAMKDLRSIDVDIFTLGQYLRPSDWHLAVEEYVHPSAFASFKDKGEQLGFKFVASGPFVRSSYRAGELFIKNIIAKERNNKDMLPLSASA